VRQVGYLQELLYIFLYQRIISVCAAQPFWLFFTKKIRYETEGQ